VRSGGCATAHYWPSVLGEPVLDALAVAGFVRSHVTVYPRARESGLSRASAAPICSSPTTGPAGQV
jgi:hypothetical protein